MLVRRNPWVAVAALVFVACGDVAQQLPSTPSTTFETEAPEVTIAEPFDGLVEVASITDGDTFRVLSADGANEPVRMIGIDAPDRGDPMWEEASTLLGSLIGERTVLLVRDQSDRDRFGRLLRSVYVGELFVNEAMVESGLAVATRYEPDTTQADALADAQLRAEVDGLALWGLVATATSMATTTSSTTTSIVTTTTTPPTTAPATTAPPTTAPPTTTGAPVTRAPVVSCHSSYLNVCLGVGIGDYDCAGGSGNGPNYVQGPVSVVGYDEFDLDREGDGVGCES
ncbi:MAG: thermonuclease family protein [Acidimicrobiia bacterium]